MRIKQRRVVYPADWVNAELDRRDAQIAELQEENRRLIEEAEILLKACQFLDTCYRNRDGKPKHRYPKPTKDIKKGDQKSQKK